MIRRDSFSKSGQLLLLLFLTGCCSYLVSCTTIQSNGTVPPIADGTIPPLSDGTIPPMSDGTIPPIVDSIVNDTYFHYDGTRPVSDTATSKTLGPNVFPGSKTRSCNEFLGIVLKEQLQHLGRLHLGPYYRSANLFDGDVTDDPSLARLESSWNAIYKQPTKYDISVFKICGSCKTIDKAYYYTSELMPSYHTSTYCNQSTSTTYNVSQSSLVFFPIMFPPTKDSTNDTTTTTRSSTSTHAYTEEEVLASLPSQYKLRSFLSLRPTHEDYSTAPTVFFPTNLATFITDNVIAGTSNNPSALTSTGADDPTADVLDSKSGNGTSTMINGTNTSYTTYDLGPDQYGTPMLRQFMIEYIPAMIAGSTGAVGIIPDYLGYGESHKTANRTIYKKHNYEQSSITSIFGVQYFLQNNTNVPCVHLDMSGVTVQGIEDGSFGTPFVSMALNRFKVSSKSVFLSSGPINLNLFWTDIITKVVEAAAAAAGSFVGSSSTSNVDINNPRLKEMFYHSLFSYVNDGIVSTNFSSTLLQRYLYPGEAAGPKQPIGLDTGLTLNDIFAENILQLFNNTSTDSDDATCEVLVNNPNMELSGSNSNITQLLRNICYEITSNNGWNVLLSEKSNDPNTDYNDKEWTYPINLCYSENDELFSSNQFMGDMDNTSTINSLLTRYTAPDSTATELTISSNDTHYRAKELCIISPLLYFSYQGFVPESYIDRPNYLSPMTQNDMNICYNRNPNVTLSTVNITSLFDDGIVPDVLLSSINNNNNTSTNLTTSIADDGSDMSNNTATDDTTNSTDLSPTVTSDNDKESDTNTNGTTTDTSSSPSSSGSNNRITLKHVWTSIAVFIVTSLSM